MCRVGDRFRNYISYFIAVSQLKLQNQRTINCRLPCNDLVSKHRLNVNDRLDSLPAGLQGLASTNSPFSPM